MLAAHGCPAAAQLCKHLRVVLATACTEVKSLPHVGAPEYTTRPYEDRMRQRRMVASMSGRGWCTLSTTVTPPAARSARMSTTVAALVESRPGPQGRCDAQHGLVVANTLRLSSDSK